MLRLLHVPASKMVLSLAVCFTLLLLTLQTGAQTASRIITGTVRSQTDEPLEGATVTVKGTTVSTLSDAKGSFRLPVPGNTKAVVVSYVGMEPIEVPVEGQNNVSVSFKTASNTLNDVVVIGYGTQRKTEVTSAISSIKAEDFTKGFARDPAQLIQGKVAGLSIATTSGNPNANTQISLRGITTLNASTSPLILIDGIPGSLNSVAPEDIESIDVLKDGSAAAIYGTRGTNGVILISTVKRRGGNRPPTISYNGYFSYQQIAKKMDFLTAADYRRLISQGVKGFNQNLDPTKGGYSTVSGTNDEFGASTDWFKQVTQEPLSHTHNLTLQGGNGQTNYTASLNYRDWEGIFKRSNNHQVTGRIDINHSMWDGKLKFNANIINRTRKYFSGPDYNWVYRQALIRNPTEPVYTTTGAWNERDVYMYVNPLRLIQEVDGETRVQDMRLSGSAIFSPIKDLNFKFLFAENKANTLNGYAEDFNYSSTNGRRGYASRSEGLDRDNLLEITGDYSKNFNNHHFTVLGGYSYQYVVTEGFGASNSNFPTDLYTYNRLQAGDALTLQNAAVGLSSYKSDSKLIGFFGRINYNFGSKYLLMASLRHEGSSKFGANNKWGNFPAISAGWRLNNEGFMKDITAINDLKLRAGYGITGTNPTDPYTSLVSLSYGNRFLYNGTWIQQIAPTRNPNPDLRWEKKQELNIGIDFGLLKNRISGSIDVYKRTTKDMLYNYAVPTPPYLYSSILANVGSMENKGVEVLLNVVPVRTKDVDWNSSLTFSTNKNKLLTLSNTLFQTTLNYITAGGTGEPIQTYTHRVYIGGPIGTFYGWKSIDLAADSTWIIQGADGKPKSVKNGNETDKQILGNGIPKYIMGWNNSFRYKKWDLDVNLRGAFGFQILNLQKMYYSNPKINQYNMLKSAFDPVYGKTPIYTDLAYVSYYIEQGDYIKIDNVSLGYNLSLKNKKYVKNARVYVSGLNLITITKYDGVDPEVNRSGLNPGVDERDKYPTTRTFTIGANLSF